MYLCFLSPLPGLSYHTPTMPVQSAAPCASAFSGEVTWVEVDLGEGAADADHPGSDAERLHPALAQQYRSSRSARAVTAGPSQTTGIANADVVPAPAARPRLGTTRLARESLATGQVFGGLGRVGPSSPMFPVTQESPLNKGVHDGACAAEPCCLPS